MSRNNNSVGPWDDSVYGTGSTQPPKNHSSALAVLLILVIFLSGIITVLGVLNIRLFRTMRQQENDLAITFDAEQHLPSVPTTPVPRPEHTENPNGDIDLKDSPESTPHVPQEGGLSLQEIYERNISSVVSISCTGRGGSASGTGVIFSDAGYIVTNYHVIEGASQISVLLSDDRSFSAGIVGSDAVSDLAVLFIDAEDLTPAQFGDSDRLRVGDTVVAIGDPLGTKFRGTMTDGIISAINRDVTVEGRPLNLIQTNAALNSGNSGGPLINCYGQVIGINTMKISAFTDAAGVEGLGFAIPSTTVREIVHQILEQGYVSGRPYLGLSGETFSDFYQHFYRMPAGLYITQVDSGSPADLSGIEPGDILISIDDIAVTSMDSLNGLLYRRQAGDTITVVIYRRGYQATASIVLAEATN